MESGQILQSSYKNLRKFVPNGIPYPSGSDWIKAKQVIDNLGSNNIWRVHDKLYDLRSFAKLHPGGRDWIELTAGTDVTEAFEAAHLLNVENVEKTLAKYFVRDAEGKRNSPYTFEDGGFYRTLKRRVRPILQEIGTGPSRLICSLEDLLVISYLTSALISASYSSIPLQLISGFLLGMSMIGAHNFLHVRSSWRKYYLDLCPLTSHEFRITHVLSHHFFPNTLMDYDVESLEGMLQTLPGKQRGFIQRNFPTIYSHLFYTQIFFLAALNWMRIAFLKGELKIEQGLIILQFCGLLAASPDIWSGIICQLVIFMGASYWFSILSQNHHHTSCFHDGDEPPENEDFGIRQLETTLDKKEKIQKELLPILTTFGEHPLHHLFPTVCHSKLYALKSVFGETLKEFKLKKRESSQLQIFYGTHRQLLRQEIWSCEQRNKALKF